MYIYKTQVHKTFSSNVVIQLESTISRQNFFCHKLIQKNFLQEKH